MDSVKFELYKLFVEDTAKFSERRQAVNNTYVSVNSIILTATAFLVKDGQLTGKRQTLVVVLLLVAGLAITDNWIRLIQKYKILVGFRIKHLKLIEATLTDCYQMYEKEEELYPCDAATKAEIPGEGLNFSDHERLLPKVFMCIYALVLAGISHRFLYQDHVFLFAISLALLMSILYFSAAKQSLKETREKWLRKKAQALAQQGNTTQP